jgi:hypothetical protein
LGILFGDDGRWSEPNYATAGSAGRSPVSSGAPLDVAYEDTQPLPIEICNTTRE